MRQAQATWLITLKRGADIKLNKASKTHEMKLQLDIQGSPWGMANIKFKRSMNILLKDMVRLKRDSPNLKEKPQHGYRIQNKV